MNFTDIVTGTTILTPEEVADFLRCDPAAVVLAYEHDELPGFWVGDEVRFREQDVVEWLAWWAVDDAPMEVVQDETVDSRDNDFFVSPNAFNNLHMYDGRTKMAAEYFAKAKALGAEATILRLGDESVPCYEVAVKHGTWNYPTAILAMTEDGGIYEATIKENEAGKDECWLVSNPVLFDTDDLEEFFYAVFLATVAQLVAISLGSTGVENSYVAGCVSHHLTTMTDDPSRHIVAAASCRVAEHYSKQLDDGTRDLLEETQVFNEVLDLTQRKRKGNFVAAAIAAIGEDMLFADEDAALEFDRRYYSDHQSKKRLVKAVVGRAMWLLKHEGYPTDSRRPHSVNAKPVITEAVV